MIILILDWFFVAVLAVAALSFGFSALGALAGVASFAISALATLLYVGFAILCVYSFVVRVIDFGSSRSFSGFVSIFMSLVSSVLALYMTKIATAPFIGVEVTSGFDLLCGIFVIMFYLAFWLFVLYGWAKANEESSSGNGVGFSVTGFLIEILASVVMYYAFQFFHLI